MILSKKIKNVTTRIFDKLSLGSVSQSEYKAKGSKKVFGGMPALIRQAAAESIVMLKNDGVLPYKSDIRLSVFGRCQINCFFVGYGSGGNVNPPYLVNIIDGLKNANANLNLNLLRFYQKYCAENPPFHGFWGHWDMSHDEPLLDDALIKSAAHASDAALVVIGRAAGEDRDNLLQKGSYYLKDDERRLLDSVCRYFSSVTVVLNCGSIIDMSWLNDYSGSIQAVLYAWQGGMEYGNSLADVLYGKVNPCGRLSDTIAAKYSDYPSAEYFGDKLSNIYSEDIFVGYRYFETFCSEKVLFPFGYGLSYTDFDIKVIDFSKKDNKIILTASVTNIGSLSGKDVLQLYVKCPVNKLSKPSLCLTAFAKTKLLQPGESQKLTIESALSYFASFDDTGITGNKYSFLLEAGEYNFFVGENIRDIKNAGSFFLDDNLIIERLEPICQLEKPIERIELSDFKGKPSPKKVLLNPDNFSLKNRIIKNLPVETGYKQLDFNFSQVKSGEISVDEFISSLNNKELEALTRGEANMNSRLGAPGNAGAFGGITKQLKVKGVPPVITTDGPAGVRVSDYASLIPCGTALACTFDVKLIHLLASELGKEVKHLGSDMLLAPGMNIHRNPLCGRNFEYFSEDPFLSGKAAAAFVKGIQSNGVSACPKHFACNNQETNRIYNNSILSQRALREIYLKGFEICVKESSPYAIMTSYNKINGVWSHYNYDLAETVLRKEWKYRGLVITDWWMRKSNSPEFPQIRNNAYRVRSCVDVFMPGSFSHIERRYHPDKSLLKTINLNNGITRAELEQSAKNTLNFILKVKKD